MLKSVCEHTQCIQQNMMEIFLLPVFLKKHEDAVSGVEKALLGGGGTKQNKVLNVLLISLEALMHEKDSKRRTVHEGCLHFPRVLLQLKL